MNINHMFNDSEVRNPDQFAGWLFSNNVLMLS